MYVSRVILRRISSDRTAGRSRCVIPFVAECCARPSSYSVLVSADPGSGRRPTVIVHVTITGKSRKGKHQSRSGLKRAAAMRHDPVRVQIKTIGVVVYVANRFPPIEHARAKVRFKNGQFIALLSPPPPPRRIICPRSAGQSYYCTRSVDERFAKTSCTTPKNAESTTTIQRRRQLYGGDDNDDDAGDIKRKENNSYNNNNNNSKKKEE